MFTNINIKLKDGERAALYKLAERERRDIRDQAAYIVRRELERLGFMEPEVTYDETQTA